jgi:hypothetical protein
MDEQEKLKLFISYSHQDKITYLPELLSYLKSKYLSESVLIWHDQDISPGDEWDDDIKENLATADIIVLLISQDFLNSGYIDKIELKKSIERHHKGECAVIPLFIRHCPLDNYEDITKLQGLPRDMRFISDMGREKDAAYTEILIGIKDKADKLIENRKNRKKGSAGVVDAVAHLQVNPASTPIAIEDLDQNSKLLERNDNIYVVFIANYTFSNLKDKNIQNVKVNLQELDNTFKNNLNFKNVFTIDNKDSSNVKKDLERIIKKCPSNSTLLLYYSGHGLIESNSFYWASEDTELDPEDNNKLLKSSAVGADFIKDLIQGCKAKYKVLIFDCCYSSAFLNNSLSVDDNLYIKQTFAIKDTYYLFSSVENQVSLYPDKQPDKPTYFTEALLKALKTGVDPNFEYCSLEQIFNLTKDELEKIKNPSGIPIPTVIKPDQGPLEEVKICANPNFFRRSTEKELKIDFESKTNDEIILWIKSKRNDPEIEKAIKKLISRHDKKIRIISIGNVEGEIKDIKMLKEMIQCLEVALEERGDLETFKEAFKKYEKMFFELIKSENQKTDSSVNTSAIDEVKNQGADKILNDPQNLKAEAENNQFVFTGTKNPNDERRSQAQFK